MLKNVEFTVEEEFIMNLVSKIQTSLRLKMLFVFVPIILISTIALSTLSYIDSKNEIASITEIRVLNELHYIEEQMSHEFTAHTRLIESIEAIYSTTYDSLQKEDVKNLLENSVVINEHTFGIGIWLEPNTIGNEQFFGPYVYKEGQQVVYTEDYEDPSYNFHNTDWYELGKQSSEYEISWTEPYFDESLNITLITATFPIYADSTFLGVITADYDLSTIQELVASQTFETSGYFFLVNSDGEFLAHQDQQKVMNGNLADDEFYFPLSQTMGNNKEGKAVLTIDNGTWESFYSTVPTTNWKLIGLAPASELYASVTRLLYKALTITTIVSGLLLLTIVLFSARMTKQIGQIVEGIQRLSNGDLTSTVDVKTKDEIGQIGRHYNEAVLNLRQTIYTITQTSNHVASSANELSVSSEETSKSIVEVSASIEEVASNTTEQRKSSTVLNEMTVTITEGIDMISANVKDVKDNAVHTSNLSSKGNLYVTDVMNQMHTIHEQVEQSSTTVDNLNDKSRKIEDIISLITSIAEKTNLLALNAAIEAARAGENGKGFVIVAEEVRKLAEQSSHATFQIKSLIIDIQEDINHVVNAMNESTTTTKHGLELAQKTGQSFKDIFLSIEDVTKKAEETDQFINSILTDAAKMETIVEGVKTIALTNDDHAQSVSAATEEQSAIMQEVTATSEELAKVALELQGEIEKFKI
ncbi:methyl-accepting chemotaxis protein [Alkalihalobacterium bogoriense]|uniref:methyl-accepting chemotaxis protein n=1 Tax=Alkalihalobacterium bogoriense TaxID=246272 RepID=UPI0004787970|nr:methyl-accepting chemotaxis protein [Alkalihalobacterium bogoriense]